MSDPRIRVGVTGHRPHRLGKADLLRLDQVLETVLTVLANQTGRETPVLLTGLAEGADQIAAQKALSLGYELVAVLPRSQASYEEDFGSPVSLEAFRRLYAEASVTEELPTDEWSPDHGYAALGRRLVELSSMLLAIWDGQPTGGPGGTAHVIEMAGEEGLPILWIDAWPPHGFSLLESQSETAIVTDPKALSTELARTLRHRSEAKGPE